MKIIKSKKQGTIISIISVLVLISLFCLSINFYIKISNSRSPKIKAKNSDLINITYNQVVRSKYGTGDNSGYYKSKYDGKTIFWSGQISAYYSQITGIKFCIEDEGHPDVDIYNSCDWFWASSDKIMGADDKKINPNWDGKWVDYTLNYYGVEFDKTGDFYSNTYWVKGVVKGIDCISHDRCVPDIDIISIIGMPEAFSKIN